MATNFEFYKDEIIQRLKEKKFETCALMEVFALVLNEDAKTLCDEKCGGRMCADCYIEFFEILKQEHIEPPKLTKRERALCEAVQTGWIARCASNGLWWFCEKPKKVLAGTWNGARCTRINDLMIGFDFIKVSDNDPWAVEDLLKLEVEE